MDRRPDLELRLAYRGSETVNYFAYINAERCVDDVIDEVEYGELDEDYEGTGTEAIETPWLPAAQQRHLTRLLLAEPVDPLEVFTVVCESIRPAIRVRPLRGDAIPTDVLREKKDDGFRAPESSHLWRPASGYSILP